MEYAENDDLIFIVIEFMNDNVGQAWDDPFISTRHYADAADLRELAEAVGLGEDPLDYMSRSA